MILKSNWSDDLGHAETGNGKKNWVVFGVNFFTQISKPSEKMVFEQNSLSLLRFFVHERLFDFDFHFFYFCYRVIFWMSVIVYVLFLVTDNSYRTCFNNCHAMFFLSRILLRPYDASISWKLLFVHSFMQFQQLCAWRQFSLLVEGVFVHALDKVFGHSWFTSLSKFLPSSWLKLTFLDYNLKR